MLTTTSAPPITAQRRLLWLLAAALLVRLAVLGATADLGIRIADEQHYFALASSIVDGRGFSFDTGPTSLRPPLYPAFVAGLWTVTGTRSLQTVRLAQIVLGLVTGV